MDFFYARRNGELFFRSANGRSWHITSFAALHHFWSLLE